MSQIKFSLDVVNNSSFNDLGIEIWLDQHKFFDQNISQGTHRLGHCFEEDEDAHQLKIVLKNKQHKHTTIDSQNNILDDALLDIRNVYFDKICIDTLMYDRAQYWHNTNNNDTQISAHRFMGTVGCNGEIVLDFYLPLWQWLLEKM